MGWEDRGLAEIFNEVCLYERVSDYILFVHLAYFEIIMVSLYRI